ncbi:MAG: thioredoxin-disulfide reductase [Deltaproteobacteria bacterium]|jgi:thioredoxin reductase (NADPH)|nr:thioredoxin-disulfide reductase [Deltaproteobacteria bacterium]
MTERELIIIGAGPAGLTAAMYARRAGISVLVLERTIAGGQMRLTGEIENWPGLGVTTGEELSESMHNQAMGFGAEFMDTMVTGLIPASKGSGPFHTLKTIGEDLSAKAVIVATGAYHKNLDSRKAQKLAGRGISFCAICDGGFYRGKEVAVIGGGNAALEQAMYLTNHASRVHLIHRRDEFRAHKVVAERLLRDPKIVTHLNKEILDILGEDDVEGIRLRDKKTGEVTDLMVPGIFMFIGSAPHSGFLPAEIERAEGGWIVTDRTLQTTVPGIFAAGDVRDTELRQIVTAAADGALAAMGAYAYLEGLR